MSENGLFLGSQQHLSSWLKSPKKILFTFESSHSPSPGPLRAKCKSIHSENVILLAFVMSQSGQKSIRFTLQQQAGRSPIISLCKRYPLGQIGIELHSLSNSGGQYMSPFVSSWHLSAIIPHFLTATAVFATQISKKIFTKNFMLPTLSSLSDLL